jgi:YebC/PmpR family DNA-binding regulatory protein
MAGHSHWARIKRAKAVTDARRGKSWSKLSRAIIVAARNGGGDPSANLALRYAIDAARADNMPKDTIERAIKKGAGELGGESYEELVYEGYGPGGAAFIVTALTDNRNRTGGEIRNIIERRGGNLAGANSAARLFATRGVFVIPSSAADEDTLTGIALEAGAEDVKAAGETFELTCDPSVFETVRQVLSGASITADSAEIARIPMMTVTLQGENAERMLKLIEELEENDDVQKVYSNYEISDADMARMSQ